jgi:SOS response regulatory protein OraA/RecX
MRFLLQRGFSQRAARIAMQGLEEEFGDADDA